MSNMDLAQEPADIVNLRLMPKKKKSHRSPQRVIVLKMLALVVCLLAAAALFVNWARNDTETQLAEDVRNFLGLPHPFVELPSVPIVVEPEPEPVMPEPVVEVVEVEPLIREMSYAEFVDQPKLWPKSLKLTVEISEPIIYRARNFGTNRFVEGQTIEVEAILGSKKVVGFVAGSHLMVPAEKTNLMEWFHETYRDVYFMRYPGVSTSASTVGAAADDDDERYHVDLLEGMRKWCSNNFGDWTFDMTDEALVLRWRPKKGILINYRSEARMIAREYLQRQAKQGATDNYAPCEIYDTSTGHLLGQASFFAPALVAQEYHQ